MFYKYNAVLRGYPRQVVEGLKGNKYVTTIYCIVSGIIKLSRIALIPPSRVVYRGLGDLTLPDAFMQADRLGICGGVELAMMSTTTDEEVAMQYAKGRTPLLFEIGCGAIDRGASLRFLSQYPGEDEILYPPLSYLEVTGAPRKR
ncbi:hypothetical protein GUITHDRAFT_83345, partial [Guillardia theta CCMP2712]